MRRRLFNGVVVLSLILCLATIALWMRSLRALDEVYGQVGQTQFDVYAYSSAVYIKFNHQYHTKAENRADVDVEAAAHPFDLLEEDSVSSDNFATRQRWPLRQSERWKADAPLFPGFRYKAWLAWARDGPGRYDWVRVIQIPYWLACHTFAVAPIAWFIGRFRQKVVAKVGFPVGHSSCIHELGSKIASGLNSKTR